MFSIKLMKKKYINLLFIKQVLEMKEIIFNLNIHGLKKYTFDNAILKSRQIIITISFNKKLYNNDFSLVYNIKICMIEVCLLK